ncbi:MAG TPA: TusE/DsrC/DsvC family sulfur relay protein [Planctomycetota bacterium]|nr:TusE/DsrC/DsvC family sulfur relay protein [Planctomycetota bacterium]
MPSNTIEGYTFTVNDEGFFTNREEWSEPLAEVLASLVGIDELTEAHWTALRFIRDDQAKTGVTPTLRRMQMQGKYDVKQLFTLFPGKPAKMMSYLAGVPKPVGCV